MKLKKKFKCVLKNKKNCFKKLNRFLHIATWKQRFYLKKSAGELDLKMAKIYLLVTLMLKIASCEKFVNKFEDTEIRGRNILF